MTRIILAFLLILSTGLASAEAPSSPFICSEVVTLSENFTFTEGPVWHPDGYLLFADIPAERIMKWEPGGEKGKVTVFREKSGKANGLTLDRHGNLLVAEEGARRVTITISGKSAMVADKYDGKKLNSPNDIVAHSSGDIYFTDPTFGLGKKTPEIDARGVYRITSKREVIQEASSFKQPNGIDLSPDEKVLYVADSGANQLKAYDVAADGSLENERVLAEAPGPDGLKADSKGRLFVATRNGVMVLSPKGELLETIKFPKGPSNCAFGSKDCKTLFVTAGAGLYMARLKEPGLFSGKK